MTTSSRLALRSASGLGDALELTSSEEVRRLSLGVFDRTFAATYALEAASALIERLSEIVGCDAPTMMLDAQAALYEEQIDDLISNDPSMARYLDRLENRSDDDDYDEDDDGGNDYDDGNGDSVMGSGATGYDDDNDGNVQRQRR